MDIYDNEHRARSREYSEGTRARRKAGTIGTDPTNCCLVCGAKIPSGYTVCGPEHGAILTAQFDAWRASDGPANVFGRYRAR